jgi:NDP-sugar pyrophosphorylase family protein
MKAMILAAGKGTRLGSVTERIPKALVDIKGKSVLQLAVEKCSEAGFEEIIVNVHHYADQVIKEIARLNSLGYRLTVSDETEMLLETGGGLYKARNFFGNDPFLLYNADIISDIDLGELLNKHKAERVLATLAVRQRKGSRFFLIDEKDVVRGWINKSTGEKIITCEEDTVLSETAFSGIHIIQPEIFNFMTEGVYTMTAMYLSLAASHVIKAYHHDDDFWVDIGTPENLDYARKNLQFPERP